MRVIPGVNQVAFTRAFAKARMGDGASVKWLIEQHEAGNLHATQALETLAKMQEKPAAPQSYVA